MSLVTRKNILRITLSTLLILIKFYYSAQLKISLDSIKSNWIEYKDSISGSKYPFNDLQNVYPYIDIYIPKDVIQYTYKDKPIQGEVIGKSKQNIEESEWDYEGVENRNMKAQYQRGILSGPYFEQIEYKYKDKSKKRTEKKGIYINGFFKGTEKKWVNKILVSEKNYDVSFRKYCDKIGFVIDQEVGEPIVDADGMSIKYILLDEYKHSVYHGIQKEFYSNGTLKSIEFYFNGVNIGPSVYYLENGDIKEYTINLDGHLINNGFKKITLSNRYQGEIIQHVKTESNNIIKFLRYNPCDYFSSFKIGSGQISSLKNLYAKTNVGDTLGIFDLHLKKYGDDFIKDSVNEKVSQSIFFENGKIEKIIDYNTLYNYETRNYFDYETVASLNNKNIIEKVFKIKEDSSKLLIEEKVYLSDYDEKKNSYYDGFKTLYYHSGNSKKIKAKGYLNNDYITGEYITGEWTYFHTNGKIKEKGIVPNFLEWRTDYNGIDCYEIFKQDRERFFNTGCPNDYNGFWEYYDTDGVLLKREVYKNGILVE